MSRTPPPRERLGRTRGEILTLLCGSPWTVAELAEELGVTRNAVRGHLAILERDGMVRHTVVRQGVGKPAHVYEATPGGRGLLSRAYQPTLRALLDVLGERLPAGEVKASLREAGRRLGLPHAGAGAELTARLGSAVRVLEELGGGAHVEAEVDHWVIRGQCCPLADLVVHHPAVCVLVESLLAEILGVPVHERCDRAERPRCGFLVAADGSPAQDG